MPFFPRIRGVHGEVSVSGLGAVIGRFDGQGGWWELTRKYEKQATGEPIVYRLRAVLSYVNPTIWNATKPDGSEKFKKKVVIRIGDNLFRIDEAEGQHMALNGRVLQSEGVTLCQVER